MEGADQAADLRKRLSDALAELSPETLTQLVDSMSQPRPVRQSKRLRQRALPVARTSSAVEITVSWGDTPKGGNEF